MTTAVYLRVSSQSQDIKSQEPDLQTWAKAQAEVTRQVIQRYQRYLYHYRKRNGDPLSCDSVWARHP